MAGKKYSDGSKIFTYGQPLNSLLLITGGSVKEYYPGGSITLGKGDVIGICELCSEFHFLEYEASGDTDVLVYPIANVDALEILFKENTKLEALMLMSAFRQIGRLLNACSILQIKCSDLYTHLPGDYDNYTRLCEQLRMTPKYIDGLTQMSSYLGDESADLWLSEFYAGFFRLYSTSAQNQMLKEIPASLGLLRKCSLDFRRTYLTLSEQFEYLKKLGYFYFNEEENDLFSLYCGLLSQIDSKDEDYTLVCDTLKKMEDNFIPYANCSTDVLNARLEAQNASITAADEVLAASPDDGSVPEELAESLNTILAYSECDAEFADTFKKNIKKYAALSDKASSNEKESTLRRKITSEFYTLYKAVFKKSLKTPMPMPARMFIYFGYVGENLAGTSNTLEMYKIAANLAGKTSSGVFTFYDWLMAIYEGRRATSRNEFDQDFTEYLNSQRAEGKLTKAEVAELENDPINKVDFEIDNLLPTANKITCGRVTTFCPVFCKDDVLKSLPECYIGPSKVGKIFEQIRSIDYSAFYRESFNPENFDVMGRTPTHSEYLPDVILMPNIGTRGIMWQEIEGKVRNSPSRMCISIFHMEDMLSTFIHMTGELRWELCKRIQGGRWNDIKDLSLTSEYYDYAQFYKKNHELSAEAKERVRTSLMRSKNSFKEMFARDYLIWIMYEGKGSPRLNKVARKILFTYCPFPKALCNNIAQNPLYTELVNARNIKTAKKLHSVDVIRQKLLKSGEEIPDVIYEEIYYLTGQRPV